MNKTHSSQTAVAVNFIRAASNLERIPQLKSNDYLASRFITFPFSILIHFSGFRRFMQKQLPFGTYEYIVLRTKYIDEIFCVAVNQGFEQIVLFGAGYDTRGIRLRGNHEPISVFEVDIEATQTQKRNTIKQPTPITYVAADLNQPGVKELLLKSGFKVRRRTLFVMEGLLMYLDVTAIDELFTFMSESGGNGSEIVFDYIRSEFVTGHAREGLVEARKIVADFQETWRFGMIDESVEDFLIKRGIHLIELMDTTALASKYFTGMPKEIEVRLSKANVLVCARM